MRRIRLLVTLVVVWLGFAAVVYAQGAKPRFIVILDNSGSMGSSIGSGVFTHGDGSETHPGCDLDKNGKFDDSRFYQAKAALIDTIAAFGSAEFALAVYSRVLLGQPCSKDEECTQLVSGSVCFDLPELPNSQKYCVQQMGTSYQECSTGDGCLNCASPTDTNDRIFENRLIDCSVAQCLRSQGCIGGQVLVGFQRAGSNVNQIYRWIDGKEDLPGPMGFSTTANREVRAETWTPIAASVESIRDWLADRTLTEVGPGAGLLDEEVATRDPKAACRPYSIILLTDGEETCGGDPRQAALQTYHRCSAKGQWNAVTNQCERHGSTVGTTELFPRIKVYVIGFTTGVSAALNAMAVAGGTGKAYYPNNQGELTAVLGDIVMSSIASPKCDCDETCDDENSAFPQKGKPCFVGVGRCQRKGVYTCNPTGDGVVCSVGPQATCPPIPLLPGSPVGEQCGIADGCVAPTPEACADDNCDGQIDEGLSCMCASQPEWCNGIDDNCNGIVDDVTAVSCGLSVGECKPGVTECATDAAGKKAMVCRGVIGPSPEKCDGKDNDCNGIVDGISEECFPTGIKGCVFDPSKNTWRCQGVCKPGRRVCAGGAWGACIGAKQPETEWPCDGLDNNCDGRLDETNPKSTDRCYPKDTPGCDLGTNTCFGECKLGLPVCQDPGRGTRILCTEAQVPGPELCNGKDDNCNHVIDEDFKDLGKLCGNGACQNGRFICNRQGTGTVCSVTRSEGELEVCDGLDNDCDGVVDEVTGSGEAPMPGIGLPCGSAVGQCKPGVTGCVAGKIVCNSLMPTIELCNGLDDNCNGSIDEGLKSPSDHCSPTGLAASLPIQGECQAGVPFCDGPNGWQCRGGRGPKKEVCDCKDNDCNGMVDDGDLCGPGHACVHCECAPRCPTNESSLPCPADRTCKDRVCVLKECVLHPCAAGEICDRYGECKNPCKGVLCSTGAVCEDGVCRDCYSKGCPAGERCVASTCVQDPCAKVNCPSGADCIQGQCVVNCEAITCDAKSTCRKGTCVPDRCTQVSCPSGSYCDSRTGQCRYRVCPTLTCPMGYVCVEDVGQCVADPCTLVRCAVGTRCIVPDHGEPTCVTPNSTGEDMVVVGPKGNRQEKVGSSCHLGQVENSAIRGWWAIFIWMILFRKTKAFTALYGSVRRGKRKTELS